MKCNILILHSLLEVTCQKLRFGKFGKLDLNKLIMTWNIYSLFAFRWFLAQLYFSSNASTRLGHVNCAEVLHLLRSFKKGIP